MKQLIEVIYPGHDGETPLVTMRGNKPVSIATPRSAAEASAIAKALLHAEGQTPVRVTDLAAAPRLRRAWFTERGRALVAEEKHGLTIQCYSCDEGDARELLSALDDALNTKLNPEPASAQRPAGERAVAA
jgi:hypothetical protein